MPTPAAVPDSILKANAAHRYYALERAIRRALEAQSPPNPVHRRELAALLLDGIDR